MAAIGDKVNQKELDEILDLLTDRLADILFGRVKNPPFNTPPSLLRRAVALEFIESIEDEIGGLKEHIETLPCCGFGDAECGDTTPPSPNAKE